MPQLNPSTVSILPPNQSSGGAAKQQANKFRYGSQKSADAELWSANADSTSSLQSQIDNIVSALRAPLPTPQVYQITNPSGALIAQVGNMTGSNNVAYQGIWAQNLYIGGNGPDTALIVADASGVTIDGVDITLDSGGVTTTISNMPGDVTLWPSQPASLLSTDNATGAYGEIDPFHVALATGGNVPVIYMENSSGDGVLVVTHTPTTGQSVAIDGATGAVTCAAGGVSAKVAVLTGADLFFSQAVGGNQTDISDFEITVTDGTHTTTITAANVDAAGFSVVGVPGITKSENYGTSLTVNTDATGVFGTPSIGQTNGTVVTGVTLVTALNVWQEGILTT